MFWIIAGILVFLWLLGLVITYMMDRNSPTAGAHQDRSRVTTGGRGD
jgi:hypothetical protein